jgi:DNA-binding NarL/FixJ family response regulator
VLPDRDLEHRRDSDPLRVSPLPAITGANSFAVAVVVDASISQTLATALAAVIAGDHYRDPALDAPFAGGMLSRQEQELVLLLLRGWPTDAIAKQLKLQPQTVREYRSRVYGKLGVSNLEQLREWIDSWVSRC